MKRGIIACAFLLLAFTACKEDTTTVTLDPPTITSMTPVEGSRGEQIVGTLHGTKFSGATSVTLGDALTIIRFKVLSDVAIEVEFSVNPDAVAGPRSAQVTTAGGTGVGANVFTIRDNRAPFARLADLIPESGGPLTDYLFDATKSFDTDGIITGFSWDFGDGKTDTGSTAVHRYRAAGTYVVILSVKDEYNAVGTARLEVKVNAGSPPDPKIVITPREGDVNTIFVFDASKSVDDKKIVRYDWQVGNIEASGPIVEIDFRNSGTFNVFLTVTDDDGLQNIAIKDIIVSDFNQEAAAEEIRFVVRRFFDLYDQIETLPAEKIVLGWSTADGCPGRQHEIDIINGHKKTTVWNEVTILGQIQVSFSSSSRANAIVAANFTWQETDGITRTGDATHDFEFILEEGKWRICNFKLI